MDTTWRTGHIAVTGATGRVGQALLARLATLPDEVRPLGREADLAAGFADAQVVAHLGGALRPRSVERPSTTAFGAKPRTSLRP